MRQIIALMQVEAYKGQELKDLMESGALIGAKVSCFFGSSGSPERRGVVAFTSVTRRGTLVVTVRLDNGVTRVTKLQRVMTINGLSTRRG